METSLADMVRCAFYGRGARLHRRCGGQLHRPGGRFGQSAMALPVRSVGVFLTDVLCDRRQTICGRRVGVGALCVQFAVGVARAFFLAVVLSPKMLYLAASANAESTLYLEGYALGQ